MEVINDQLEREEEAVQESRSLGPPVATTVLGGGAVLTGTILLVLAGAARRNVEDASDVTWQEVESDAARARTFGMAGAVALAAGAVLAGVGIVLWATGSRGQDADRALLLTPQGAVWSQRW